MRNAGSNHPRPRVGDSSRIVPGRRPTWLRAPLVAIVATVAAAAAGCSNLPDASEVKLLPSVNSLVPSPTGEFAKSAVNTSRPVAPADLVDAQGACAGSAAAGEPGGVERSLRGVGLDMTECEVVQVIGPANSTEIGANARGDRTVVMTYSNPERSGVYRFTNGRLTTIERGAEPAQPAPARGKPPRRQSS